VLNRRLPGNYRTRCLVLRSARRLFISHNVPQTYHVLGPFRGAARLKQFAVVHAPRQISPGLLSTAQSSSPPIAARLTQRLLAPGFWLLIPLLELLELLLCYRLLAIRLGALDRAAASRPSV
jgi:hypothetical protein